jgi:X-X-X-Leu-X-X-Gly heptad repeat protein
MRLGVEDEAASEKIKTLAQGVYELVNGFGQLSNSKL